MPANQQTSSYVDQLREMRTTRMQQLRQGGQQSSLMNKQISVLGSLNTTMNSVLKGNQQQLKFTKDSIDQQKTLVKQTSDMTKSITNLSSSLARTVGGLAAAVGRGAVSAGSSVGGAAVSGASSIASGVASMVAKTLPFAIAGVLGKVLLWDNMSSETQQGLKKSVGDLFGRVFEGAGDSPIGKMAKPIIDQFKIVSAALSDTLEGIMNSVKSNIEDLIKRIEESFTKLEKKITEIQDSMTKFYYETLAPTMEYVDRLIGTVKKFGSYLPAIASVAGPAAIGVGAAKIIGGGVGTRIVGGSAVTGAAAGAATGVVAEAASASTSATMGTGANGADKLSKMEKALEYLKQNGLKPNKQNLLVGWLFNSFSSSASGTVLKRFTEAIEKYKIKGLAVIGLIIQFAGWAWVRSAIVDMNEKGILDEEETKALLDLAFAQAGLGAVFGTVLGAIGAAGGATVGSVAGPIGTAVGAVGGGVIGTSYGTMVGNSIAGMLVSLPKSVTNEIDVTGKSAGDISTELESKRLKEKYQKKYSEHLESKGVEKTKDTMSGVMDRLKQSVSGKGNHEVGTEKAAVEFFMSRGWTKEQAAGIVGNLVVESNGLQTDAVGDGGKAYGLAQWHPDRQKIFKEYKNKDIRESSFQEQLEFVDWELRNTYKKAGLILSKARTASDAAELVDRYYEQSKLLHTPRRIAVAERLMKDSFDNTTMASAESSSTTGPSTSFFENYKRRSEQMKAAEQPKLTREEEKAKNLQDLKEMASGSSVWKELGRIGNIYKQTTEDLEKGSETMSKGGSGTLLYDSSDKSVTNIVNNSAGGGGGGVSFNPVYPGGFNQTRTQFNSMAGMMLA